MHEPLPEPDERFSDPAPTVTPQGIAGSAGDLLAGGRPAGPRGGAGALRPGCRLAALPVGPVDGIPGNQGALVAELLLEGQPALLHPPPRRGVVGTSRADDPLQHDDITT